MNSLAFRSEISSLKYFGFGFLDLFVDLDFMFSVIITMRKNKSNKDAGLIYAVVSS